MKNDYVVWSERGDQHAHRYLLKAGEVSGSVPRLQTHTASERNYNPIPPDPSHTWSSGRYKEAVPPEWRWKHFVP